jgi:hypothetical protein
MCVAVPLLPSVPSWNAQGQLNLFYFVVCVCVNVCPYKPEFKAKFLKIATHKNRLAIQVSSRHFPVKHQGRVISYDLRIA